MDFGELSAIHNPYMEEINIVNNTGLLWSYTSVINAVLGLVGIQSSPIPHLHILNLRPEDQVT